VFNVKLRDTSAVDPSGGYQKSELLLREGYQRAWVSRRFINLIERTKNRDA